MEAAAQQPTPSPQTDDAKSVDEHAYRETAGTSASYSITGPSGPRRFAGWFQPWTLTLIVGLPALGLIIYRRADIAHKLRSRDWKRRTRDGRPPMDR